MKKHILLTYQRQTLQVAIGYRKKQSTAGMNNTTLENITLVITLTQ